MDIATQPPTEADEDLEDTVATLCGLMEIAVAGYYAVNSDGTIEGEEVIGALTSMLAGYLRDIEDETTRSKVLDQVCADLIQLSDIQKQ